jgi:hypothetical protein
MQRYLQADDSKDSDKQISGITIEAMHKRNLIITGRLQGRAGQWALRRKQSHTDKQAETSLATFWTKLNNLFKT